MARLIQKTGFISRKSAGGYMKYKAILELVKHRLEFINSISPSDDTIRAVKKEDIRLYREKLRKLGLKIYGKAKRTVDP